MTRMLLRLQACSFVSNSWSSNSGVAGNAGLFGAVRDVAALGNMYLAALLGFQTDRPMLLKKETVQEMIKLQVRNSIEE